MRALASLLLALATPLAVPAQSLSISTIAGGGGTIIGNVYEVKGTVGQPTAK